LPLYDFKCKACNHKFEKFTPLKTLRTKCTQCRGQAVRLISLPGAIICDGNFSLTGKVDRRLGGTPITGRKDYHKRVKDKGFRELSSRETKDLVEDADDRGKEPAEHAIPVA
jgi:putative FmdB family regulatory protein